MCPGPQARATASSYRTRDLADCDLAVITPEGVQLSEVDDQPSERQAQHVTWADHGGN
jgi:hypothetical protein